MNCKTCGKKFHACGSCGLSYNYEYKYCSYKCWINSDEYKSNKEIYSLFFSSLNEYQKSLFHTILEWDDDLAGEYEKWELGDEVKRAD